MIREFIKKKFHLYDLNEIDIEFSHEDKNRRSVLLLKGSINILFAAAAFLGETIGEPQSSPGSNLGGIYHLDIITSDGDKARLF